MIMKALCMVIMKTLCVLGIPNLYNIHNLKYSQNSTSAVRQVIIHNVPDVHKVPNKHIIYFSGAPSLYSAGYAKSDFTTCLPTPQRCWGPLGRSASGQAVFGGPDFWRISGLNWIRPSCTSLSIGQDRYGSTYSIVQGTSAFAEIRPIYFGLWCAKMAS